MINSVITTCTTLHNAGRYTWWFQWEGERSEVTGKDYFQYFNTQRHVVLGCLGALGVYKESCALIWAHVLYPLSTRSLCYGHMAEQKTQEVLKRKGELWSSKSTFDRLVDDYVCSVSLWKTLVSLETKEDQSESSAPLSSQPRLSLLHRLSLWSGQMAGDTAGLRSEGIVNYRTVTWYTLVGGNACSMSED